MLFEPGNRLDVEMVRGLVEEHEVGGLGDELGERGAAAFAARGGLDGRRGVELEVLGHGLDAPHLGLAEIADGVVAERRAALHLGLLRHVADAVAGRDDARARVGFDEARHDLHQRRLARAIPPDERQPVALLHGEREAVEDRVAAEGQRDVGQLEQGRAGHGGGLVGRWDEVNGLRCLAAPPRRGLRPRTPGIFRDR